MTENWAYFTDKIKKHVLVGCGERNVGGGDGGRDGGGGGRSEVLCENGQILVAFFFHFSQHLQVIVALSGCSCFCRHYQLRFRVAWTCQDCASIAFCPLLS